MSTLSTALRDIDMLVSRFLQLEILGMPDLSEFEKAEASAYLNELTALKFLAEAIHETPSEIQKDWWIINGEEFFALVSKAKAFLAATVP
jgi:hypothetical protein